MDVFLEFEKPIATLEKKLQELRELSKSQGVDLKSEIKALEGKVTDLIEEIFANLTPWQKVQLSRHPNRPHARDYIEGLFPGFMELYGDRGYAEDAALISGMGYWPPQSSADESTTALLVLGLQKGRTTQQKMKRNFGMAKPEGYRKAIRLMGLAERLRIPILTFVDTPGAYPGLETEERGQAQAVAECIQFMFGLTVPVIAVVIGEGGSGGALAIGVANKVLMQEYSTYSVISPEGCASILWSDSKLAEMASERLKMSPQDLLKLKVIDGIIPEPKGGAHRSWPEAIELMKQSLLKYMNPMIENGAENPKSKSKSKTKTKPTKTASSLQFLDPEFAAQLRADRIEKFRKMGNLAIAKTKEASS